MSHASQHSVQYLRHTYTKITCCFFRNSSLMEHSEFYFLNLAILDESPVNWSRVQILETVYWSSYRVVQDHWAE